MITKNELVVDAFEQLRISGLTVSPSPSEITSAVRRMDSMILSWQNQGLCLNYNNSEGYSKTDPLQESGIADSDALAVVLNLAKTLAPSYGQQIDRATLGEAKTAFEGLYSVELTMREPDTFQPTGAGNSVYGIRQQFSYQEPEISPPSDCSANNIFVGQIEFYTTDFADYLAEVDGDTIASYTAVDGESVKLLSDSISGSVITLECEGVILGFGQIIVTVTTSSGRVFPRGVIFDVKAV